jgi:hypothetical protein
MRYTMLVYALFEDLRLRRSELYIHGIRVERVDAASWSLHCCGMHAHLLLFSKCFTGSLEDNARLDL